MRRAILTLALLAGGALLLVAQQGGLSGLTDAAAAAQRQFQNAMAQGLRALRAGEPGALWGLWSLAFAYGFVHAVGPGHGKLIIGAYGAATRVTLWRLSALSLLSSLAQATSAVVLVYAAVGLFKASRAQVEAVSDAWLEPLSLAAIAALGLWLCWRGLRRLTQSTAPWPGASVGARVSMAPSSAGLAFATPAPTAPGTTGAVSAAAHPHDHANAACSDCGHRHGPELDDVEKLHSWRDAALLIGAIALRPCTGALFLLILTWRMGLDWAGIAGAYAMGLGTASVTVAVAALSVMARDGALLWAGRLAGTARLMPVIELLAGAVVVAVAGQALLSTL